MSIRYEETQYGFNYGALDVERCCSDERKGWIVVRLKTPKSEVDVYVTKTGKMRINGVVIGMKSNEH